MKNTKGYEINLADGEIIITRKFSKLAGVIGSNEYNIMITLRKDFPDFKIVLKSIEKKENSKRQILRLSPLLFLVYT